MKNVLLSISIFISILSFSQDHSDFETNVDVFFKKYCFGGLVDYKAVKDDDSMGDLLAYIAKDKITSNSENLEAYYINVYNLFVIYKMAENYPVSSPNDISGFFTSNLFTLDGKKTSLNNIEKVIAAPLQEPRFHFVMVCGALSCPPITNFSYTQKNVHEQMDKQTVLALNNPKFVYQVDEEKTIYLSEIFKWYKTDFGKTSKEVVDYINNYREIDFNTSYKIKYYPYNWIINDKTNARPGINLDSDVSELNEEPNSINLQYYTAGSLLAKGKMDITLFNAMYTENRSNWKGENFSGFRTTFVSHLLQLTIGTSKNKRINLGLDLNFKSSGSSTDSKFSGVKNAFTYKNNDSSRVGIASVGLRIKLQPFKAVPNFTMQSTVTGPTIKHPEGINSATEQNLMWAEWNRIQWWNQFFYTKDFGKFQLFTEIDLLYRFRINNQQIGMLDVPVSAFLSYFPTNKVTIYAMTQHLQRFTNDIDQNVPQTDWVIPASYTASGIGLKYQLKSNLNIELLYTNFWQAKNAGFGQTFNIGIKYLTK